MARGRGVCVCVRIEPELRNPYDSGAFLCFVEGPWQRIRYIVREAVKEVHAVITAGDILWVKFVHVKYLIQWYRSAPGFYACINIVRRDEWSHTCIQSSRAWCWMCWRHVHVGKIMSELSSFDVSYHPIQCIPAYQTDTSVWDSKQLSCQLVIIIIHTIHPWMRKLYPRPTSNRAVRTCSCTFRSTRSVCAYTCTLTC